MVLAFIGAVLMGSVLVCGFTVGDFVGAGGQLLAMSWGIVSLVDVYIMLALFSSWIIYREKSVVRSAI
jgi:hypothetical protein